MPAGRELVIGFVVPAVIALVAGVFATPAQRPRWWRAGVGALAIGVAYAIARWWLWGWNGVWPAGVFDRLGVTAVGIGVAAWVSAGWPRGARWVVTALVAMAALAPIALRAGDLDGAGRAGVIVGLGLLAALVALVAEETTRARPPLAVLPAVLVAGAAISLAFIHLSAGQQGQSTGFVCAALGGAWVAGLITKRVPPNAIAATVLLLAAILVTDWRFNDASSSRPLALLLLGIAPLGVLVGEIPGIRNRPWPALMLRVIAVGALAYAGLTLAGQKSAADAGGSDAVDDQSKFYGG